MRFYSTNNTELSVSVEEALFHSLPADNGLYMPTDLPFLGKDYFDRISNESLAEIGFAISKALFNKEISDSNLEQITQKALIFNTPVIELERGKLSVLELFHGPSLAFKDVGARYMAALMSYFSNHSAKEIHILVATSGDTGGAVAMGFHELPGVRVSILYPSGRVSDLQEKQLTTLGGNVQAFEVDGSFDDCQAIVKRAFLDTDLTTRVSLSSANSINIFRLIPQSFYYVHAYGQVKHYNKPVVFSTPSGNFGNLSAGVMVQKMGLPVHQFIAATNLNHAVPTYIKTGEFTPKASVATVSNAMDVGNPSNFPRLLKLYDNDYNRLRENVSGYSFSDEETLEGMQQINNTYKYVTCPHTAVGLLALRAYLDHSAVDVIGVSLATAHPAKFKDLVEATLHEDIIIPPRLEAFANRKKQSIKISSNYDVFKESFTDTIR